MKQTYLLYILFTFNNIFYIILDLNGNLLIWTSSGRSKIKGLKKITLNSIKLSLNMLFFNLSPDKINFHIKLRGLNKFKKIVLSQLKHYSFNIISICDETIISHNGCKLKKKRKI